MHRLTHRDLAGALQFLATCDVSGGLQQFAASVTRALPALISADVTVFAMADLCAPSMLAIENPRVTSVADRDAYMRVTQQSWNPILDHFGRTHDTEARRMSDLVTRRTFHSLPLYTDFYRRMRLEYVLGIPVNDKRTAFDGITLNRARRDFTERDRSVLTLLRPHLIQGYRTAVTVDRLRAELVLGLHAVETPGFGLIGLGHRSRMDFASSGAAALLARYFEARRQRNELPDSLARWVRSRLDAAVDANRLPSLATPFIAEQDRARLYVHLVSLGRKSVLLLEEPTTRRRRVRDAASSFNDHERVPDGWWRDTMVDDAHGRLPGVVARLTAACHEARTAAMAGCHLTPHEVRVLRLLADGHSYKTAAAVLHSSANTVAFHLKHIYAKLNVHSKSEAVGKALREGLVR